MHVPSPQGVYKNPSVTRILFKNVVDTNGFHFDNGWLGTAKSPTP